MPRPMIPAPITATRADFSHSLPACSSFPTQVLNHALIARFGLADVFAQAGALLLGHRRNAGADTAEGGGDVVDVIHEADKFSSCGHEGSLRIFWRAGGTGRSRDRQGNYSLFNMPGGFSKGGKQLPACKLPWGTQ